MLERESLSEETGEPLWTYPLPLSSQIGAHATVNARMCPWLLNKSLQNSSNCSLFARNRAPKSVAPRRGGGYFRREGGGYCAMLERESLSEETEEPPPELKRYVETFRQNLFFAMVRSKTVYQSALKEDVLSLEHNHPPVPWEPSLTLATTVFCILELRGGEALFDVGAGVNVRGDRGAPLDLPSTAVESDRGMYDSQK